MTVTTNEIRRANRVRELGRMSRGLVEAEQRRVMAAHGMRRLGGSGRPSKDEMIYEILELEGLNARVLA